MIVVTFLAIGTLLSRQDDPDYLEYQRGADALAIVATSIASCQRLGFKITTADVGAAAEAHIIGGVREGMSRPVAERLLLGALENERDRLQTLHAHALGGTLAEIEQRVGEHVRFWAGRCSSLAESPTTSRYIQHSSPEQEAAALEAALSEIKAEPPAQ